MKRKDFRKLKKDVQFVAQNLKNQTKTSQNGSGRWVQEASYVKNAMIIKEWNLKKR